MYSNWKDHQLKIIIRRFATPWSAAHQAPPSMGFSRQEYWSGAPLPSPSFHHRGLEYKRRKSRDTCCNRQVWPWSTKWSRAKATRVLQRECTSHRKHPPPTQDTTLHMNITRCSIPKSDWLYSLQPKMEKCYTVSKNKTRIWLWLRSWTPYCQIQTEIEESRENH